MAEQEINFEEISQKLQIYCNSGSLKEKKQLENEIILQCVPLVKKIVKNLARRTNDPYEDILQVGIMGLIKAVQMYNYNISSNFKTYATYCITGEIRHYLRDKVSMIKAPREIYELCYRMNKIIEEMKIQNGIVPTDNEIAERLNQPVSKIREARTTDRRKNVLSLDFLLSLCDENGQTLHEIVPDTKYNFQSSYQENKILLSEALNCLDGELRQIIEWNFFKDITQTKIAQMLDISQMQVSRKIKKALKLLLDYIEDNNDLNELKNNTR